MTRANYGCNCTTRSMKFTRLTRDSKCMKILLFMALHPRQCTLREILHNVYGNEMGKTRNWGHGFFAALSYNGFASYIQRGRTCLWYATGRGINFWKSLTA